LAKFYSLCVFASLIQRTAAITEVPGLQIAILITGHTDGEPEQQGIR